MESLRPFSDAAPDVRKPFTLPPGLDMGTLKLEDLHFDPHLEAVRLRAVQAARPAPQTR